MPRSNMPHVAPTSAGPHGAPIRAPGRPRRKVLRLGLVAMLGLAVTLTVLCMFRPRRPAVPQGADPWEQVLQTSAYVRGDYALYSMTAPDPKYRIQSTADALASLTQSPPPSPQQAGQAPLLS